MEITKKERCIVGSAIQCLVENKVRMPLSSCSIKLTLSKQDELTELQAKGGYASIDELRQAIVRLMEKISFETPGLTFPTISSASVRLCPSTEVSSKLAAFLLEEAQHAIQELQTSNLSTNLDQTLRRLSAVDAAICRANPDQMSLRPIINTIFRRHANLHQLCATITSDTSLPDRLKVLHTRFLRDEFNDATTHLIGLSVSWLAQVSHGFETLFLRWKLVRSIRSSDEVLQAIIPAPVSIEPCNHCRVLLISTSRQANCKISNITRSGEVNRMASYGKLSQ
jgi:hypothetical protein